MVQLLPFEEEIQKLDTQIENLQSQKNLSNDDEIIRIQLSRDDLLEKVYSNLSAWNTVKVARHPQRPQTSDYIKLICRDFREIHGDRAFGDDPAIICGFARIASNKVMLIGHQKGKTTNERIKCQFGCAHPEGYRKALRAMKLAEKFSLPIVCLIDTPGAYPGLKAEERGQAEAIARNLFEMSRLKTPIVSIVIGEGGSGGALGIGVADKCAMLQHSWYSVISPEGCAAILWKIANEETNAQAADALALTAKRNLENGIIETILREPLGGAHRNPEKAAKNLENWITQSILELKRININTLTQRRFDRFRTFGATIEKNPDIPLNNSLI